LRRRAARSKRHAKSSSQSTKSTGKEHHSKTSVGGHSLVLLRPVGSGGVWSSASIGTVMLGPKAPLAHRVSSRSVTVSVYVVTEPVGLQLVSGGPVPASERSKADPGTMQPCGRSIERDRRQTWARRPPHRPTDFSNPTMGTTLAPLKIWLCPSGPVLRR
jgi:hypothetical protein